MPVYIGLVLRLVLYLVFLAAVLYAFFWLLDQRGGGSGDAERRRRTPKGPGTRGPLGPDDDDEFLRELERRRRHGS